MQIALIKTGALGDVVRTTALLPGLARQYPGLQLTWITAPGADDLVRGLTGVNEVALINDPENAPWRRARYDWTISLDDGIEECSLATQLVSTRISGGFLGPLGTRLYTEDLEPWFGMGILRAASRGGLAEANALKKANDKTVATLLYQCLGIPSPVGRTSLPVGPVHRAKASDWLTTVGLNSASLLIGMNTGAGGRWRYKSWGEDQTSALARRLVDNLGAAVVILGGEGERDRNEGIVRNADRPGVVAGPSDFGLLDFSAIIESVDLLVTSDSLALHLAVAVGRPVVSFFGPTSADEIEDYGLGTKIVTPLSCRCCYLKDCDIRPHCMQSINVDTLVTAVEAWLPQLTKGPESKA